MHKHKIVWFFGVLSFVAASSVLAQGTQQTPQREEIILTTYYPTPYGDYDRMRVNRISVGDTNGDGQRTAEDLPTGDGQAYFAKSAIYNPQGQTPANWPAGTAGELAFSKDEGAFYYYNGSAWVAQGGGGASLVGYGTDVCPNGWQEYYKGVAMTMTTTTTQQGYAVLGGGGSVECKAGEPFEKAALNFSAIWLTGGAYGSVGANSGAIPCIVCVR